MTVQTADMTPFSGLAPLHLTPVRDEVVVRETICESRGDAERRRNDDLLLTRQAREIADQAATIRGLESRLARASAQVPLPWVPPTSCTADPGSIQIGSTPNSTEEAASTIDVHVQKVTVLPTAFTNIGSLLDVFA